MINKLIIFITIIPWILYYIVSILNNLKKKEYQTFSFSYLKKNFFQIFRIDLLFLIIIFFIFSSFKKEFVDKYLFAVMCLYLLINSFYERKEKTPKHFYKDNVIALIVLFLLSWIPFIFYVFKPNIRITYCILLCYLFLEYFLVLIASIIQRKIKKEKVAL